MRKFTGRLARRLKTRTPGMLTGAEESARLLGARAHEEAEKILLLLEHYGIQHAIEDGVQNEAWIALAVALARDFVPGFQPPTSLQQRRLLLSDLHKKRSRGRPRKAIGTVPKRKPGRPKVEWAPGAMEAFVRDAEAAKSGAEFIRSRIKEFAKEVHMSEARALEQFEGKAYRSLIEARKTLGKRHRKS